MPQAKFRFFFIVLLLVAATAAGIYLIARRSLPQVGGEITVTGIEQPVEVLRDTHGIPHIFAQSEADAHFALGFVHAQDRLWQMEMNRRIAAGRLAEVVGPAALDTDRFLRTLGIREVAEANVRALDADSRRLLAAYAAGVNAFLATRPVLPPEFWLLGITPEPWSDVDSAAWVKMLAWDLGGNWRSELLRLQLARSLPTAAIQQFLPPYPGDEAIELPNLAALYGESAGPPLPGISDAPAGGSNSWVVSGAHTKSGKPLLANDPHLGLTAPGIWYFAHLHAPGLNAIGATLPGVPGVVIGRNDRIAWSATNTGPDVQDLYLERLDSAARYLAPEGWRPFQTRRELIHVKGAPDVELAVRVSRHGPVISDVVASAAAAAPRGEVLALAWTALAENDASIAAIFRMPRARDWPEFLEATRALQAPQQNLSYADVDGNIGFIAPGRIPVRKPENALRGLAPAPGWDARYDWQGTIPFAELPRAFNPTGGRIVTANQKIVPPGYRHHITSEWQPPYRALRIAGLLDQSKQHERASFARMQMDVVSLPARELLPRLLRTEPKSAAARDALRHLAAWDGTMSADRREPLLFTAWWRELARALYADELGSAFRATWSERPVFTANVLAGQSKWCDDARTPATETCGELLSASLERALADVQRYDDTPWGEVHHAEARHRPLTRSWLRRFFDITVPSGGDGYTLNVGRMDWGDAAEPFANRHAASLRAIYDLADPEASVFIHPTGQSGNPLSAHYRDLAPLWARGEYLPMTMDRARLEAAGVERLVLKPRR